jgi:hypothetical protein
LAERSNFTWTLALNNTNEGELDASVDLAHTPLNSPRKSWIAVRRMVLKRFFFDLVQKLIKIVKRSANFFPCLVKSSDCWKFGSGMRI